MEFEGMYDGRFKLRLLSSIMGTYLPDDRQPPRSPSELSMAVSVIRRHHLLSELVDPAVAGKILDSHKAAMDAWVERINLLLSSSMTEKCWAGVCLLGVTCQECPRQRFADSYTSWFQKLVLHLKPTDPLFVRGAAFASLTDLLVRLGSIGVRREGTALSVKLVQPVLQLLSDEGSKSIWNDGIDMLCTMLKFFPASIKQQSSQVEALLVAKLMEVDTVASLSQKFARSLALLPRAHGDAATWNSLSRRILLAINCQLDDAFKGMEDGALAKKVLSCLMPRGQEQTWFLGSVPISANAMAEGAKRFWQLLVPRVSALIQCCNYLLVNSFPVQVPVPLTASLALITRILSVDGTTYRSASVLGMPSSSEQQVSLCCELPALHSCALDLLYAVLCGVRGQLLPRAGDVVRLLTDYFHRCGLPSLRIKLYNISKHLLISMGVGMATELAPALLENLLADLKGVDASWSLNSPNAMSWGQGVSGWGHVPNTRKRKDPGGTHMDPLIMGAGEPAVDRSEAAQAVAVQTAALEAAEALLTVGGALRSDQWRMEIDTVVARVASIASTGSLSPSLIFEDISCKGVVSLVFSSGSFQMAAYKALLASILSPCMHRPPYLSQALAIFRKGRLEAAGTEVAAFCAHALLALEPLLHPRSLPLASPPMVTMQAMAPGRGQPEVQDNLVVQMQRPVLPLQGGTGPLSAAAVGSHGYSSPMVAPSSLKVNDSGMQIEVEGDPYVYVQEDIESWIVDYGGDQSMLNDGSCSMVVEAYEREFPSMGNGTQSVVEFHTMGTATQNMAPLHTMGNATQSVAEFQTMGTATQNVVAGLGHVSARQSLADDEDRVMMSMVGDLLAEPREVSRTAVPGEMPMDGNFHATNLNSVPEILAGGNFQAKAVNGGVLGLLEGQQMATRVMDVLVPASESHRLIPVSEPLAGDHGCMQPPVSTPPTEIEQSSADLHTGGQHADLRSSSQQGTSSSTQQKQEPLPPLPSAAVAPNNLSYTAAPIAHSLTESDSDAIPDIVDGDPDTD